MGKPTEISQVINTLQSNPLPNGQPTAQAAWIPTSKDLERMRRLWDQLVRLYRHKWISSEGLPDDDDGMPTENFLMWAYEFHQTASESLLRGLEGAKEKVRDSDTENWPPTLEEFKGLCAKPKIAPAPGSNVEAYKYVKRIGIEDITKKEEQAERNHGFAARLREGLKTKGDIKL